jgi:hypothetical protein
MYTLINLGGRWGWLVNATPRPLYPRERLGTHCTEGWVGPRAGLDGCGKSRPTGIGHPYLGARSESLYRLRYPGPHCFVTLVLKVLFVFCGMYADDAILWSYMLKENEHLVFRRSDDSVATCLHINTSSRTHLIRGEPTGFCLLRPSVFSDNGCVSVAPHAAEGRGISYQV